MHWGLCTAVVLIAVSGTLAQNGKYTTSVAGTIGGNSQGACVFPFTYKGVEYGTCTTRDNRDVPWCSLTSDYGSGNRWARCQMNINATRTRQRSGNAGGSSCYYPFIYKGKSYYTCIVVDYDSRKPWCATSPDYDRDRKWGECIIYPYIRTTGGNAGAQPCVFPFIYQGRWTEGCLIANQGQYPWCATTRNYDEDKLWGRCIIETITGQSGCNNDYTMTTNTNTFNGRLESGANTVDACRSACNANSACRGFDFDRNPGTNNRCYIHNSFPRTNVASGVDQYRITVRRCTGPSGTSGAGGSVVTVIMGNSPPDRRQCVFPFISTDGRRYGSCSSSNWYTPWCSLTGNYARDKQWGECNNIRMDSKP